MRKTIVTCDKCKSDLPDGQPATTLLIGGARGRGDPTELCDGCAVTLLEWLTGPALEQPPAELGTDPQASP